MFSLFFLLYLQCLHSVNGDSYNMVTYAGTGSAGFNDGPASSAMFNNNEGVAVGDDGVVYIGDSANQRIRKITLAGQVSTFAGSGTAGTADGPATSAQLYTPHHISIWNNSFIFVADYSSSRVKMVSLSVGYVSTLAGGGSGTFNDAYGTYAAFLNPVALCPDSIGNVFVSDTSNHKIRKISPVGQVTTLAGSGTGTFADGTGAAASFQYPQGAAIDLNGNLYVADSSHNRIRKVTSAGVVTTFAGSATASVVDGTGGAATFSYPRGIAFDARLSVFYTTDWNGNAVRRITLSAVVTTIVSAGLVANPTGIAVDSRDGNVYFNDRGLKVRKIVICPDIATFDATNKVCSCGSTGVYDSTNRFCICKNNTAFAVTDPCICSPGQEYNVGRTQCVACGAGKFRAFITDPDCTACPLGTEPTPAATGCVSCGAGKYRPSFTQSACIGCPLYATCNATSIISSQTGFKINAAGTGCEQCPVGTQSSSNYLSCVSCTAGTNYRSSLSQSACQACPGNSACSPTGFTCYAGYEPTLDGLGCSQCTAGYSKPASGNTACTQCSIGTESASDRLSCVACVAGKYRPDAVVNKCIPCPPNGSCTVSVLTCNAGYKLNAGGDGCEQCPIGQDSISGGNCQGCQSGLFKPSQSFETCVSCPQSGLSSCGGSSISCQSGYYFDNNVQCKRNGTFFALQQTVTQTVSTVTTFLTLTQTTSLFATITAPTQTFYQTQTQPVTLQLSVPTQTVTMVSTQLGNSAVSTITVTSGSVSTVTASGISSGSGQQAQSGNVVTIDFIGTLPVSPLIFGVMTFSAGFFVMLIVSLICCRKPAQRSKVDDFDGAIGMTTAMNTTSQRTFTSTR